MHTAPAAREADLSLIARARVCVCFRSRIHGRGLFCKRSIDNGEMVIEYSGEIIRSLLTDKREKYYESKVCWYSVQVCRGQTVTAR